MPDTRTVELLRRLMNVDPSAPFAETFNPATDSLESIRNAITALESGIFTYAAKFGPVAVELNDLAQFGTELLNPGDEVIPTEAITPGTVKLDRIRDGALTNIVSATPATEAPGRIYYEYQFLAASWQKGDLFLFTFSGGSVVIDTVTTSLPDAHCYGRLPHDDYIEADIGNFQSNANLATLKAILGIPDTDGKPLYTCLIPDRLDHATFGLEALDIDLGTLITNLGDPSGHMLTSITAKLGNLSEDLAAILEAFTPAEAGSLSERVAWLKQFIAKGTGTAIGANLSLIDLFGIFDGGTDPQGDIYQALGVPTTNSLWSAVQYINEAPCPATPIAGSINDVLVEDIYERTLGAKNLNGLLGVVDIAGRSINGNIGDFQAQTSLQTLLDSLGIPDVAGKDLYTCIITDRLGAVGDVAAEAGLLLPRLKFYGEGIIKGTGTAIPANSSLYDAIGSVLARANSPSLYGILGVADAAGRSITGNLGDFQAQTSLQTLLAALGIPDVAAKPFYTCVVTDRLGAIGEAAAEAGTLLPRLKFYGQGIIEGTGTIIPNNSSLYDAIGLVLARGSNPSLYGMLGVPDAATYSLWANIGNFMGRATSLDRTLLDVLGIPDDADGSLFDRLGDFTSVQNLKHILGDSFTPADNLFACLGGYDADDSLKDHIDYIKTTAVPVAPLTKTINYYIQAIGSNDTDNDFASPLVTSNPIGSVLERLQHLQEILDDNITDGTHSVQVAHGIIETPIAAFTPNRNGKAGVEFDLTTLIDAVEGGTITVRLKHQIDNGTLRTIDKQTFVIGVDEVHPTVEGWLDANNPNGAQITIQCSVPVTAPRSIPWKIVEAA